MNTKSLFALAATLLLAGTAQAQTPTITALGHDPAVTVMTRTMSNHMRLNEGQYVKLYSINRVRMTRQHEIERVANAAIRTAQLAELQQQYEQECARILTPVQLAQMQQEPAQFAVSAGRG